LVTDLVDAMTESVTWEKLGVAITEQIQRVGLSPYSLLSTFRSARSNSQTYGLKNNTDVNVRNLENAVTKGGIECVLFRVDKVIFERSSLCP
jgi:hypothetical protein